MKGRPSYAYSERLMKKMGWTEGKGLGKNENGSPDFIRPKVKVNTKGIGFTGVDDRWIEHQEAFDSLLGNLNDGNPAAKEDKLISVEERAFKLGGRVHYSKFLRGKDLSQKKKEDLNAIVVKRKNKKDLESVRGADSNGQGDLSGVKTHTSSLSYQEYFAQRMKASKRRRGLEEDGDSQSCEQNRESGGEDSEMKSVKKSKRFEKNTSAQNEWTSCTDKDKVGTGLALNGVYTENAGSSQDENVQPKKKKKKLKDKFDDGSRSQSSEMSVEQREETLMKDPVEVATMPDKFCQESVVPERRKKPKHADDSEPTLLEATVSHTEPCSEGGVSQQVKRKSRHKSCDSGESEEFENVASSAERALKEDVLKKQKKSKRAVENEEMFKQHGQLKKLKRDLADEDEQIEQEDRSQVRKRGTSKAAVLDANAEVLPKDCELGKPKQKQEAKEKKGVAKLNAKASAREGSSQLLEVASKKCEQEQEENDEYGKQIGGACVKAKSVPKQNLKEDASFGNRNPQQKQTNQNTKGNKQSKQGQEDIAAAEKGHSEEDVPRRQKKSKCTAKNEAVFEQCGQSKKLKCDLADENEQIKQEGVSQVRKRGTSEAVVLGANAEVLSKDCELGKPKQKQEAKEKKGVAKLNAKANAREGSSQQQEVASKKCEQEQEKNDKYENQIGGARVTTKTVSKQKLKKDASFGVKNLQQKQTNQNTEGNERPKQVLEDIAAPEKRRPEKKVVQTSNIPQKKLKKEKKSSGSKLKQNEGTGTKPVVKKHNKDKYENQIGEASVKTKTVSKQKPKKGASFGNKNLQQEQTNQNTEGNGRPKQVLEDIAATEKRRPEKKVVQTSNIPQKKLKKENKSSGSKLKQNEGTGTKPVVKKHDKDKYENQIGGASVKTKTVSKQKPKKGASFGNKNLQQEQTNQNTKGNKRPKQGLGDVAAPEKCHSEKKVVRTSNIPQKKLKKEKKSSGSKLKQNERTRMKPVVKKHDKHKYENQIGGARVKTKTVSKQKRKKDASFGNKNPQQEQTNQNTKGNKRPKQGLADIAPPGKRRPEKKVVQTSNIPQKKLKKEKKSSGSKLKQNERTGTKPVVKKHDKDASKLAGENSKATATKPVSGATRHLCPVACSSARLEEGTWMPYFNPNISVRAIDDRTAASMAQWVVDTVENSGSKITPYKACHLDKETYAALLSEHILKRHRTSNWMQIPGYGSDSWVQGIVNYLKSEMLVKGQKDASSSASKVVE
ncbi:uncharacterized protein LOC119181285 isoform X2 [Rhipicephalus microplus]|uniref:uncharacterized protein LOC119181285 isoform X2 n=1 Tax=Rhipicephalus microplus TaxID=6941 RepID=UPI003F6AA78E